MLVWYSVVHVLYSKVNKSSRPNVKIRHWSMFSRETHRSVFTSGATLYDLVSWSLLPWFRFGCIYSKIMVLVKITSWLTLGNFVVWVKITHLLMVGYLCYHDYNIRHLFMVRDRHLPCLKKKNNLACLLKTFCQPIHPYLWIVWFSNKVTLIVPLHPTDKSHNYCGCQKCFFIWTKQMSFWSIC